MSGPLLRHIETSGSWEERGPLVIYTTSKGLVSSIRARNVDLDLSRLATQRARELIVAQREARKQSEPPKTIAPAGLVVTNADIGRASQAVPRILMYSTQWCGYCKKARRDLKALGADFYERDIDRSATAKLALIAETGGDTSIPYIHFEATGRPGFETSAGGYYPAIIEAMVRQQKAARERDKSP